MLVQLDKFLTNPFPNPTRENTGVLPNQRLLELLLPLYLTLLTDFMELRLLLLIQCLMLLPIPLLMLLLVDLFILYLLGYLNLTATINWKSIK